MSKLLCILGSMMCVLLLSGCLCAEHSADVPGTEETINTRSSPPEGATVPTENTEDTPQQNNSGRIERWKLFEDTVLEIDATNLPLVEVLEPENGTLLVFNQEYCLLTASKWELPLSSGWRIDPGGLDAIGRTESGHILLTPNQDTPPLVCMYDSITGQLRCYQRMDISENGIGALESGHLRIIFDESTVTDTKALEQIWDIHTSKEQYQEADYILDGEWHYERVRYVYDACPAVQYEINYAICDDLVFVENQNCGYVVSVPADLLR